MFSTGKCKVSLVTFAVIFACGWMVSGSPVVQTSLGKVEGHTLLSRNGRQYYAFNGMPYAQPPINKLRFMAPEPATPWEGTMNGTVTAPPCYQKQFLYFKTGNQGQEDCLYLDVYSPNLTGSLPVLVYVHGGSFNYGWPGSPMKSSYFMDEEVVLVGIAYRLGNFGFLSYEDEVIPGNYGLKDQVQALEWVKREIINFGGNPDLITAFGISAGGASTHFLCSIPKSKDILKGCISQSGIAGAIWSIHYPGDAKENTVNLAKNIGCGIYESSSELLECLQKQNADLFITDIDLQHVTQISYPNLEVESETAVLTEWPTGYSDFPWIAGFVANEGLLITQVIKDFSTFLQKIKLFLFEGDELLKEAFHIKNNVLINLLKIKSRFFSWSNIFDIYKDYERLITEAFFQYPTFKEMTRHNGPKYVYNFAYTGGPSLWEVVTNQKLDIDGVSHADDGFYLFNLSNYYQPEGWPSDKDVEFSKQLVKLWVNFAKNQAPGDKSVQWDQFDEYGAYLHIDNDGIGMKNFTNYDEIISFWDNIN